jgi:Putative adhesin
MPTFDTPAPISALIEFGVGDLRVVASDRTDTVVEVRPTDPAKQSDVVAAEQTRVEFSNGTLLVKAPKGWRQYTFRGGNESIDVEIELPSGSHVQADAGVAAFRSQGRLGECRFKNGVGDIRLEQVAALQVKSGGGDITVDRATGHADVTTGSGAVRLGELDAGAVVKDSNGDIWLGQVSGELRVTAANGEISVDRAGSTVVAKTANGDVRLGEVARGTVVVQTASGSLEIGVRNGVAAWLDVKTQYGTVYNTLDTAEPPPPGAAIVEVRARTSFGDISVHRSGASQSPPGAAGDGPNGLGPNRPAPNGPEQAP